MITDQQRTYFDEMEKMFNTEGWKLFIDDLRGNQEAIKSGIMSVSDHDSFLVAKGRFLTLTDVLGLQAYLESTRKNLEEQEPEHASI